MQEEEKKIEPMVDIDTSGPGADIELPEELISFCKFSAVKCRLTPLKRMFAIIILCFVGLNLAFLNFSLLFIIIIIH